MPVLPVMPVRAAGSSDSGEPQTIFTILEKIGNIQIFMPKNDLLSATSLYRGEHTFSINKTRLYGRTGQVMISDDNRLGSELAGKAYKTMLAARTQSLGVETLNE